MGIQIKHLKYFINIGGEATMEQFYTDWGTIGSRLLHDMTVQAIVIVQDSDLSVRLSPKGLAILESEAING